MIFFFNLFLFCFCFSFLPVRLVGGDLAYGMQTQETTAVQDRDYVPLKTLLANDDNGLPVESKEHPV